MEAVLTYESALKHYKALLRWLVRLESLSHELRYEPYIFERAENDLKAKLRKMLNAEGIKSYNKKKHRLQQKAKRDMPFLTRLVFPLGETAKETAKNINDVLEKVKETLTKFSGRVVIEVPGIVAEGNGEYLTSGNNGFSKGSFAFGVWKGRTLWLDKVNQTPFWILRRTEAQRISRIVEELMPWGANINLPQGLDEPEEYSRKILTSAPVFMRLLPMTDFNGLNVSIITWVELPGSRERLQFAVNILNKCILLNSHVKSCKKLWLWGKGLIKAGFQVFTKSFWDTVFEKFGS